MTTPRTSFVGGVNPFSGRRTHNVKITNDIPPQPQSRAGESKYSELFESMQVGQSIACAEEEVNQYYSALRNWLIQRGLYDTLRPSKVKKYKHAKPGTPQARVWLLERKSEK